MGRMAKMTKGMFVSFEGVDGSGKTTVMNRVLRLLQEKGLSVVSTREPGGDPIAEQIRNVILDNKFTNMDSRTEALLFAASRRQHIVDVLLPLLDKGHLVLSDRFIDSSLAYQGYARGLGIDNVLAINEFATDGLWPEVTYFLDVKPIDALKRMALDKGHEENRLDVEKLSFHAKVYAGYELLVKRFPNRIVTINGYLPFEKECDVIATDLYKRWTKKNSK